MSLDWKVPTLTTVFANLTSSATDPQNFTAEQNVIQLPNANEWTFWIMQAVAGGIGTAPHPMHLHGHDFYILGAGAGNFSDAAQLKYVNPMRRDVAMLPADGWLVIAFRTNNPGAWLMHW